MSANSRPYLLEMSRYSYGVPPAGSSLGIMCGATAISDRWVLTAAHCVHEDTKARDLIVTAGEYDVTSWSGHESRHAVKQIIEHEDYDSDSQENDVALLELKTAMDLSDSRISAIALNDDASCPTSGQNCRIMGWGTVESGGDVPDKAKESTVPVVSNKKCTQSYGYGAITDGMLCAGEGGTDTCQGDSGGPFICTCNGVEKHVGVVSFGAGCADAKYPGVYARTSYYLDWISKNSGLSKSQLTGGSSSGSSASTATDTSKDSDDDDDGYYYYYFY